MDQYKLENVCRFLAPVDDFACGFLRRDHLAECVHKAESCVNIRQDFRPFAGILRILSGFQQLLIAISDGIYNTNSDLVSPGDLLRASDQLRKAKAGSLSCCLLSCSFLFFLLLLSIAVRA